MWGCITKSIFFSLRRLAVPSLFPAHLQDMSCGTQLIPMDTSAEAIEDVTPMDVDDDREYCNDEIEVAGEIEVDNRYANQEVLLNNQNPRKEPVRQSPNDHDYELNIDRVINAMERLVIVEEENVELKKKLRQHQKNMSRHKIRIGKLEKEVLDLKSQLKEQSKRLADPLLLELQQNKNRKLRGARYSNEMKNMAIVLHYCSTKAYRQMRKFFTLPSVNTIQGWLSKLEVKEGYTKSILQLLKIKVARLPADEKLVTIVLDEMSITQRLTYVANAKVDYFQGFPTKVGNEDNSLTQRANNALTIMVKSIKSGFKQAIGYFFNASSANASRLKEIVNEGLKVVTETGLIPKMITCDQNSTNRALFKTFGVTDEQPWFVYQTERIYCAFDAPHLIKSTRNNLLRHNAVFDGKICSFEHITQLFNEDIKHIPRSVPKLSYDHIELAPFTEMNVGKAAQTLSESVSAGIRAYVHTNKLSSDCINTANYCESFDKLFDCANSITFKETKVRRLVIYLTISTTYTQTNI